MDDERTQRTIDRMREMDFVLAQSKARLVLADTVIALLMHGRPVNAQILIAELLEEVRHLEPTNLVRMKHEAAARLLGWNPAPSFESGATGSAS